MTSVVQPLVARKGNRLAAVLYANSKARFGTYVALAKAIEDVGHLAIVATREPYPLDALELVGFESVVVAPLGPRDLRQLRDVDVFFASEVVYDVAPPGSATVGVFHSLPDGGLTESRLTRNDARVIWANPTVIRAFDYLVAAVKQNPTHWNRDNFSLVQGVYPTEFLTDRRPVLDIVPGGYPKLDYSRRVLASTTAPDCIVYSPTSVDSALTRVRDDGAAILMGLLEAFPDVEIVFRPYPSSVDLELGRAILGRLPETSRLVLDDSTTGLAHQQRSFVAISDSSSSAITFSMATNRPLVFVNLAAAPIDDAPESLLFGLRAHSIRAMVQAVQNCIDEAPRWADQITSATATSVYNPGSASTYLARHLQLFADRQSHPDWLSIERTPWAAAQLSGDAPDHVRRIRAGEHFSLGANGLVAAEEIERFLLADSNSAPSDI